MRKQTLGRIRNPKKVQVIKTLNKETGNVELRRIFHGSPNRMEFERNLKGLKSKHVNNEVVAPV